MTKRTYASPAVFKQALEQRLRAASGSGPDLARRRQLLVFDRFLARIVRTLGDAAMLKGGLVLELRLSRARTTKDIDLRLMGSPERVTSSGFALVTHRIAHVCRVAAMRAAGGYPAFAENGDLRDPFQHLSGLRGPSRPGRPGLSAVWGRASRGSAPR